MTDVGLKEIAALKNLTALDLSYTKVTDAGLKEITALKNLALLNLTSTRVTFAGLKDIGGALKNLTALDLSYTRVTDAGLKEIAVRFKNLRFLDLSGNAVVRTKVTDVGLKEIAALKNLTSLNLNRTKVTFAGVKEIAVLTQPHRDCLRHSGDRRWLEGNRGALREPHLAQSPQHGRDGRWAERDPRLKNLTSLNLGFTEVTDAGLKEIAALRTSPG